MNNRVLHEIDEIGSAPDELSTIMTAYEVRGFAEIGRPYILKVIHCAPSAFAVIKCFTAATMLG